MNNRLRLVVLLALLPIFGLGCAKVGPRVVKAPQQQWPPSDQLAPYAKDDSKTNANMDNLAKYEVAATTTAAAYLELENGSADIVRSGARAKAVNDLEISSGDRIVVTSGTVYLVYPDAGMAQLESGSDVVFLADDSHPGVFMDLRLMAGKIWTRFERLLGKDEQYSVTANGVVSTVRGTAFGVGVDADGVDVQVAEHGVEVTTETAASAAEAPAPLTINAGETIKIITKGVLLQDIRIVQTAVRQLTAAERISSGFVFGLSKIPAVMLSRPPQAVRLKAPPAVPQELQGVQTRLLQRAAVLNFGGTFVAPLRAPTSGEAVPLNAVPTINGPTAPLIK